MIGKIVIAIDSFKGCMSSEEAEECCAEAVKSVLPECDTVCVPMADGGEGFASALAVHIGGSPCRLLVSGPLGDPVPACYFYNPETRLAVMDMAQASGLTLVPEALRNPLKTSTFGTGEMIADAVRRGAKKIIVGIGGSATNDGGMGMLSALGIKFSDIAGTPLYGCGADLLKVDSIDSSELMTELADVEFTVAADVTNPLCGKSGATHVFGPQKGASDYDITILENGMKNYKLKVNQSVKKDLSDFPGAGAAGGLGYAFLSFFNAHLTSGIDILLDKIKFNRILKDTDIVITGEGCIDAQSVYGKTIYGILNKANNKKIPVIAIAGKVLNQELISKAGFLSVASIINKPMDLNSAMDKDTAKTNIKFTIQQILNIIKHYHTL